MHFVRYRARKNQGKKLTRTIASDVMKLCLKNIKNEQKVTHTKKRIFSQGVWSLTYSTVHPISSCICIFSLLPYWYIITYLLYCTDLVSNPLTEHPLFFFGDFLFFYLLYCTTYFFSYLNISLLLYWYIIYSCLLSYSLTMY